MGAKQVNLSGLKFNRLLVLEYYGAKTYNSKNSRPTNKRIWKCLCDCGKIVNVATGALTGGNTKSCGCWKSELSKLNSINSRYKLAKKDTGYKSIYNHYKRGATVRKLSFNIEFEEFQKLLRSKCFYCNCNPSNLYMKSYYNVKYNGIDRIDNKIGYEIDNVVPCCKMCNISKNNYTFEIFFDWITRLSKNYKNIKKFKCNLEITK